MPGSSHQLQLRFYGRNANYSCKKMGDCQLSTGAPQLGSSQVDQRSHHGFSPCCPRGDTLVTSHNPPQNLRRPATMLHVRPWQCPDALRKVVA